ncbi:MAG: hypothetical protein Kow0029_19070 [Candidatus Rifleibacteriota bacterium]
MKPRILFVDDEPNIIYSYSRGLRKDWELVTAMSGEEALKAIDEQGPFSVIVSDFNMPRMDGITFLAKSMEKDPESIRMMLTGEGDFQIATKAVNEGHIFRFITKPCPLEELNKALKDAYRQFKLLQMEKENRRQELEIAGEIQKILLLEKPPENLKNIDLAALTVPSKDVDGDFIDFFQFSPFKFDLIVGDVMGKGLHAAMVGAGAKNQLAKVMWKLAISHGPEALQPAQIMTSFNEVMNTRLEQLQKFITMVYARFKTESRTMTFVDAGHTPILWYSSAESKWHSLKGENSPIGLSQSARFIERMITFLPGDLFLFYSDGLMDGKNSSGAHYGDAALFRCLDQCRNLGAKEVIEALKTDYESFVETEHLVDDLTIVVVKITT